MTMSVDVVHYGFLASLLSPSSGRSSFAKSLRVHYSKRLFSSSLGMYNNSRVSLSIMYCLAALHAPCRCCS